MTIILRISNFDKFSRYAIRNENYKAIEYLLSRGINPLSADTYGRNAIHFAVECESYNSLIILCEGSLVSNETFDEKKFVNAPWIKNSWKALDCSIKEDGLIPFHLASMKGNSKILKYLIHICEIRKPYSQPDTDEEYLTIDEMLEYPAKYNLTPLLLAAQYNKLESFQYLVMIGANIYAKTTRMQNILHLSVINKNEDIVRYIMDRDAEECSLKYGKDCRGKTPVQYAKREDIIISLMSIWESIRNGRLSEIETLVARSKGEVHRQRFSKDGNTPLHYAVKLGLSDMVKFLIELDCPKDLKNSDGKLPVDLLENIENLDIRKKVEEALNTTAEDKVILHNMKETVKMQKTTRLGMGVDKFGKHFVTTPKY